MSTAVDPGPANLPPEPFPKNVPVAKVIPGEWWHNAHAKAPTPLEFSDALGRFSGPGLVRKVLYLSEDTIGCFWECGLGRDLLKRMFSDRSIRQRDLEDRMEYKLRFDPAGLRLFDSRQSAARRAAGAQTIACFCGKHTISRAWAGALMDPALRLDGMLYDSVRQSSTLCLALFDTPAAVALLARKPKPVRSAWDDPILIASLVAEGVSVLP
jgi:RES domain